MTVPTHKTNRLVLVGRKPSTVFVLGRLVLPTTCHRAKGTPTMLRRVIFPKAQSVPPFRASGAGLACVAAERAFEGRERAAVGRRSSRKWLGYGWFESVHGEAGWGSDSYGLLQPSKGISVLRPES